MKGVFLLQKVEYNKISNEVLEQLSKGAFLTVKDGNKVNTMTIAWGSVGFFWARPVFTVGVRYSRYTYDMMKNIKEFTVSIPAKDTLKEELIFCGRNSGRDFDKFKETGLSLQDGNKISTPVIDQCEIHYECKIVYKQAMEPAAIDEDINERFYSDNNYHVMFYGEIVDCYRK